MLHHCKKAIQINPNNIDAYNNLGLAQKKKGQLKEAVISFKNGLRINSENYLLYISLGSTLMLLDVMFDAGRQANYSKIQVANQNKETFFLNTKN